MATPRPRIKLREASSRTRFVHPQGTRSDTSKRERGHHMCKKLALTVAILAGVAAVLTFTRFGSYSRTIIAEIKQSAKDQVPVELEIKRLKDEVSRLGPDLRKNLSVVAEQMASV